MYYNLKQSYTPALELFEFNERALIIDTETVGAGAGVEIIEIALCDHAGRIVYESLVRPTYNQLPRPSKHQRLDRSEFAVAPYWGDVWPRVSQLIEGRLLIAYNAGFDRRALSAERSRHRQSPASGGGGARCS